MELILSYGLMTLFLVVMEGALSFDNALALAALVKHLPEKQRKQALTYGVWGAIGFRVIAIICLQAVISNTKIKAVAAGYLIFLVIKHFWFEDNDDQKKKPTAFNFWKTILVVELTDIAFSIDSIVACVAVGNKFWVTFAGGALGILMMRFVSNGFAILMNVFPRLEDAAYVVIFVTGMKLAIEAIFGPVPEIGFLIFLALGLGWGFTKYQKAVAR